MTAILALINGLITAELGLLHLYWATGGQWGIAQAVPTDESGKRVLNTSSLACIVVGLGLLGFALYYFSIGFGFSLQLPFGKEKWGIWVLAFIFTARAVGDFRYVGFFKKLKNTEFGRLDTRWYAPLCLWLGMTSAVIGLQKVGLKLF
jgi:hypothetical protein